MSLKRPHSSLPLTATLDTDMSEKELIPHSPEALQETCSIPPVFEETLVHEHQQSVPTVNFQRLFVSGENGDFLLEVLLQFVF